MACARIAPNLIEVGFMTVSNVLIEMFFSKEINFKENLSTAIQCSACLPLIFSGWTKKTVARAWISLSRSLFGVMRYQLYSKAGRSDRDFAFCLFLRAC